jgi:hypothetical protein
MTNTPDDYSGSSGNDTGNLVTEQVKQSAQQVAQQSQDVASQVVQGAQQQAQSMLSTRKDQLTGSLNSAADALRQTGDTLRNSDQAPMAGIMDTAADKVSGVAGYFEGRDIGQIVADTENYARGNPAVFLGGAFLLGLAAARFLKSSTTPPTPSSYGSGTGYGSYAGYSGGYNRGYVSSGSGYNSGYGYDTGYAGSAYGAESETYLPESVGSLPSAGIAGTSPLTSDAMDSSSDLTDLGADDVTTSGSY